MTAIRKGTVVRQVMPKPEIGVVTEFNIDQEFGKRQFKVEWPDATDPSITHSGFYNEDEVEVCPAYDVPEALQPKKVVDVDTDEGYGASDKVGA